MTGNKLEHTIRQVEDQWLIPLYTHCRKLFSKSFLPSHDHHHHYRVWSHTRNLMKALHANRRYVDRQLIEQAIIAVFFHDTGLTETLDESHGVESRHLCEDFFSANRLTPPSGFEVILGAIERHDDKSVSKASGQATGTHTGLLPILSTCDDLDAFGNTGTCRYAEIYLCRNIAMSELPERVLINLENRYRNLHLRFGNLISFVNDHSKRYRLTHDFYTGLGREINGKQTGSERSEIIKYLSGRIHERVDLLRPGAQILLPDEKQNVSRFLSDLQKEVNQFSYPETL